MEGGRQSDLLSGQARVDSVFCKSLLATTKNKPVSGCTPSRPQIYGGFVHVLLQSRHDRSQCPHCTSIYIYICASVRKRTKAARYCKGFAEPAWPWRALRPPNPQGPGEPMVAAPKFLPGIWSPYGKATDGNRQSVLRACRCNPGGMLFVHGLILTCLGQRNY